MKLTEWNFGWLATYETFKTPNLGFIKHSLGRPFQVKFPFEGCDVDFPP